MPAGATRRGIRFQAAPLGAAPAGTATMAVQVPVGTLARPPSAPMARLVAAAWSRSNPGGSDGPGPSPPSPVAALIVASGPAVRPVEGGVQPAKETAHATRMASGAAGNVVLRM